MEQDNGAPDGAAKADGANPAPEPTTIGGRLRAAREGQGRSLAEISALTKVPARALDAVERMAMAELPAGPYAVGFVRTYARALGLDAEQAVAQMRAAIGTETASSVSPTTYFEPADAARVPPARLVWVSLGIAAVIAVGYGVWRSDLLGGMAGPAATEIASVDAAVPAVPAAPQPQIPTVTIAADAPVLISATDNLYFALEDANGRSQFDLTLNAGEFYTVKQNQRGLFLRTTKPQALKLVVDGRALPPIGSPDTILSGVGLDGPSLSRIASGQWTAPVAVAAGAAPSSAPVQ